MHKASPRISEIQGEPVIGKVYMVPCLPLQVDGLALPVDIPVLGDWHTDKELAADFEHAHVDVRFIELAKLVKYGWSHNVFSQYFTHAAVLGHLPQQRAALRERPMLCVAKLNQNEHWMAGPGGYLEAVARNLKNGGAKLNLNCKVCPHRGTPLNSIKPTNGIILCPAHGLRFSAETGEIIVKN